MRPRDAHFFRRVPADVSEATKTGGIVSLIALLTICWLVLTQYAEYASNRHVTQLRLDQARAGGPRRGADGGGYIRINFNITMAHLPCQYATLHVADHVGSHKMGGERNVHKVRLSKDGLSLGMYEAHKYAEGASVDGNNMATHVFPWHKKEHNQGDATHRQKLAMAHLSPDQRHVVGKVESNIRLAGKGAQAGRRLLSIEEPVHADPHGVAADTSPSCGSWADHGECLGNSGYMLAACATACQKKSVAGGPEVCKKWATQGRCKDAADFMSKVCAADCGLTATPPAHADAHGGQAAAAAKSGAASEVAPLGSGDYTPATPFSDKPAELTEGEFSQMLRDYDIVFVNFYAPWCFWSNRLTPAWNAVGKRLHARAYSQSVKFIKVDCTSKSAALCKSQSIHAFPSVRIYRGSTHAFEPYEFGREENVMWLHLVKSAAEILVSEMQEAPQDVRERYAQRIAHVSADLREVMDRRAQGLDEDWSEDALSADEEVAEDKDLLAQIQEAVSSLTGAKGVAKGQIDRNHISGMARDEAEQNAVMEHSTDVVLGLLSSQRAGPGGVEDAVEGSEPWSQAETHEGCNLFGYIDVSRAPGTLHVSPHSARHSFNFSSVNTTHLIDHLSFGLELTSRERAHLPTSVQSQLATLDGYEFIATVPHETQEHHVNIMPTSYGRPGEKKPIETYQFTATSHGRTRDTLPSLLISYDVSPIHAHIAERERALSDFILSLCAIVGGAVSVFGIVDAMLFTGTNVVKKNLGKNF